jgi:endonuclease YncB( thermonuclease family)
VADVDDPQIRDRYGRLVAVVSWFNVNEAMIADGYADL